MWYNSLKEVNIHDILISSSSLTYCIYFCYYSIKTKHKKTNKIVLGKYRTQSAFNIRKQNQPTDYKVDDIFVKQIII